MLAPWKKSYDQPRKHIKKQRHYVVNRSLVAKAKVFPVVVYGCESWTIKKAEHWRIDAFELWYWRRLFRGPWTAMRYNQSILKEISPGCSLEAMMLKLKLQYFGHLLWRVDSLEKTDAGRDWGQEEKGTTKDEMAGWHHRLDGHEFEWTLGVGDGQGSLVCCSSWDHKELDVTEWLNWTELNAEPTNQIEPYHLNAPEHFSTFAFLQTACAVALLFTYLFGSFAKL